MIYVDGLTKWYGDIEALHEVAFHVAPGEIVGLLGPNGAGKSTTIKCLTGYLHPDEGKISVDGLDVLQQPREVQARVGYLPENTPLYADMSVQAYLRMIADLREVPEIEQRDLLSAAIYATGLQERLTQPIGELSKGFRQRVGLAQAILHQPRLLILDEPTIGLDPTQVVEVRNLIKGLASRSTILFSSHILSEVEAICDRVIILINGEVKADARLQELAQTTDATLVLQKEVDGAEKALGALSGVRQVQPLRTTEGYSGFRILGAEEFDLCPAVFDLARRQDWPLRELRRDVRTLETVFNELAGAA
ncbi:MAG: ATP-binding cassette domain-containing protein [Anaerolineales bacterium]|nr:ATP-binding cassette domain-containing protein [Anaerolineales bacterium]HJO33599.1 ATP-binding cassette domain-containing protein [Anaerolineales bacterium]